MEVIAKASYSITLNLSSKEFKLFSDGLGATSTVSRSQAGMTEEQSDFFGSLYMKLPDSVE